MDTSSKVEPGGPETSKDPGIAGQIGEFRKTETARKNKRARKHAYTSATARSWYITLKQAPVQSVQHVGQSVFSAWSVRK